jgi:membrane-bound serine protease (ClpP class)
VSPLWRCALVLAVSLSGVAALTDPARADIPVIELDGAVHAVSAEHVVAALDRADAQGAPLAILRLDTPGGLDSSMRQIIDRMLNGKTPVAVFVGPAGARAASAGFVILVAADVAAMAPGTNTGAAHPVSALSGMDEVMTKKVTSDAAAYVRGKAAQRGRNVEMAEKAVVESRAFTDKEALELKLIDLVARDVDELVRALDGRQIRRFDGSQVTLRLSGQRTVQAAMNWRQLALSLIARPEILFLLLMGAVLGLGIEMTHPGLLFPGILGAFCLILFLFAAQIVPVNGAGVLLILLAVGLFAAEVKVTSYGLLTVAGLIAMILGAMMLVDAPVPEMRVPLAWILPGALGTALGVALLLRLVWQAQRRPPMTGGEGMVGLRGVAAGPLDPEGWVQVAGERWRARAEGAVAAGDPIEVVSLQGLRLNVRRAA